MLNSRGKSTCFRWQDEAVVDPSWASPSAARLIECWGVEEDVEKLSGHKYQMLLLRCPSSANNTNRRLPSNIEGKNIVSTHS